jgi:hypothetical protein
MTPPVLSPTAVAVWGIEPESLNALEKLRDFQPSPMSDPHAFLRDCQSLAVALLTSANLKDQYETNAAAVLRLQSSLGEVQDARNQRDADVDALQLMLNEKATALARAEATIDHYQRTPAPTTNQGPSSDRAMVKIPDPPKFAKGRDEYRSFKSKLNEKFLGDAHRFRDEDHRLAYAVGLLTDEAHAMVRPLREGRQLATVTELLSYLDATFEDPDRRGTAERELRTLKQANSDFTSHYAKFQSIVTVLGWGAEAERAALYNSLSYELKEALSRNLPPTDETLTEYVARVKRLDDQIRRFAAECKPPGGRGQSGGQSSNKGPRSRIPHSNNPADSTGATSHLGSAPMDLAAKQRVEARQAEISKWVAEGKCTKCGSDQHWRRNCPKTTNRPPLTAAATASSSDSTGSTPYATAPPTPAASVTAESGKE